MAYIPCSKFVLIYYEITSQFFNDFIFIGKNICLASRGRKKYSRHVYIYILLHYNYIIPLSDDAHRLSCLPHRPSTVVDTASSNKVWVITDYRSFICFKKRNLIFGGKKEKNTTCTIFGCSTVYLFICLLLLYKYARG